MDPRFVTTKNGIGASAQIEGVSVVGGIPPTPGSPGGTASIVNNANPAVTRAMWIWGGAVVVLMLFHIGGSRLG